MDAMGHFLSAFTETLITFDLYYTWNKKHKKHKKRFSFPVSHSGLRGLIAHFIFSISTLLFTGIIESTGIIIREEKRHTWHKFFISLNVAIS